MRGFRNKLILLLIVYFAGFATAIYTLAPVPEGPDTETGLTYSVFKSDDFAKRCNNSLHKGVDFVKDISVRASEFIKEKIDERKDDSS